MPADFDPNNLRPEQGRALLSAELDNLSARERFFLGCVLHRTQYLGTLEQQGEEEAMKVFGRDLTVLRALVEAFEHNAREIFIAQGDPGDALPLLVEISSLTLCMASRLAVGTVEISREEGERLERARATIKEAERHAGGPPPEGS